MAAGTDGFIEFTLIDGKIVNINVTHIVSIEELTTKDLRKENFRQYGSTLPRNQNISKLLLSSGIEYRVVSSGDSKTTAAIVSDTKSTKSTVTLSGGKF